MSAATGHLRNYVAGVIQNGETDIDIFNRFVVRPDNSASRRLARQQRIEQRRAGKLFYNQQSNNKKVKLYLFAFEIIRELLIHAFLNF